MTADQLREKTHTIVQKCEQLKDLVAVKHLFAQLRESWQHQAICVTLRVSDPRSSTITFLDDHKKENPIYLHWKRYLIHNICEEIIQIVELGFNETIEKIDEIEKQLMGEICGVPATNNASERQPRRITCQTAKKQEDPA